MAGADFIDNNDTPSYSYVPFVDLYKYQNSDLLEIITKIIKFNLKLSKFWQDGAIGWAPEETSRILIQSRMDRMVSFSHRLNDLLRTVDKKEEEAHLILSWTTLGSLVECITTLFFAIHRDDYLNGMPRKDKKGKSIEPNRLSFDQLKSQLLENELIDKKTYDWITDIQNYRNAIHFFRDKKIGSENDLHNSVKWYFAFLEHLNEFIPYPNRDY